MNVDNSPQKCIDNQTKEIRLPLALETRSSMNGGKTRAIDAPENAPMREMNNAK